MEVSFLSLKEKAVQHWFSYYQIARKYKQSFMTISLCIIFDRGSSSVVYIFHKRIRSLLLCGYEVQTNMYFFDFEQKSIFKTNGNSMFSLYCTRVCQWCSNVQWFVSVYNNTAFTQWHFYFMLERN